MVIDLDARLAPEVLDGLLPRLGFRSVDADDAKRLAPVVLADQETRSLAAGHAAAIVALQGDYLRPALFPEGSGSHPLGAGVPHIFAFLSTYPEAVSWRPGQTTDLVDASLADLGQQVHIHRQVRGEFGLHALGWVQANWAGGLVRLDRLQFNVERMPLDLQEKAAGQPAWWIHIPQDGPLENARAMNSVALARDVMARLFPAGGDHFYCSSWLLDPVIATLAGEGSNLARFLSHFGPPLRLTPNNDAPLYYAFNADPTVDRSALPRDSRLRRGILDHLDAQGQFHEALCRWEG